MPIKKLVAVSIPEDMFDVVEETAEALGIKSDVLIAQAVYEKFSASFLTRGIKPPVDMIKKAVKK